MRRKSFSGCRGDVGPASVNELSIRVQATTADVVARRGIGLWRQAGAGSMRGSRRSRIGLLTDGSTVGAHVVMVA